MRASLVVLALFSLVSHVSAAPKKLWELTGLNTPESVVLDPKGNVLYVSNVNGKPLDKDGNGYLSKVSTDGTMIEAEWVKGFNAPKGLALFGGMLFVADIDELVVVDVAKGAIIKKYPAAKGAQFFNDAAVDKAGRVFVSDTFTNTIWHLDQAKFEPWITDARLKSPNGLLVQGDKIIVGGFGKMPEGGIPGTKANLIEVSLLDKSIRDLGDGSPVGYLDGVEPVEGGSYLVTDWVDGALLRIDGNGKSEQLLDLNSGSADLTYLPDARAVLIPLMKDNALVAYELD